MICAQQIGICHNSQSTKKFFLSQSTCLVRVWRFANSQYKPVAPSPNSSSIYVIYQSISRLWMSCEYSCDKSAISLVIIIIIVHLWCAYYKKDIGALQSQQTLNAEQKKWVLRCFRKTAEFGSLRMLSSREFHADGPACEKARSPNLDRSCGSVK